MCNGRRHELYEPIVLEFFKCRIACNKRITLVVPEFLQGDGIKGAQHPPALLRALREMIGRRLTLYNLAFMERWVFLVYVVKQGVPVHSAALYRCE